MSITTSAGCGSRRRIENGASEDAALWAAQALTVLVAGDVKTGDVLTDMDEMASTLRRAWIRDRINTKI